LRRCGSVWNLGHFVAFGRIDAKRTGDKVEYKISFSLIGLPRDLNQERFILVAARARAGKEPAV